MGHRDMTADERLAEILRAREKVRDQEEVCKSLAEKKKKATTALSDAESKKRELERDLEDVIDDRPPGPLFDGAHARPDSNADLGAGDGPILDPRPPEDIDRAIAAADEADRKSEARAKRQDEQLAGKPAKKKPGRPKKAAL